MKLWPKTTYKHTEKSLPEKDHPKKSNKNNGNLFLTQKHICHQFLKGYHNSS